MCQMKKGDTTRRLGWQDLPFFADWLKGSEASLKFSRLWGRVMTGENILQPPSLPRPPASGLLLVLPIPFSGGDERPRDSPEILPREGLLFSARPQRERCPSRPGRVGGPSGLTSEFPRARSYLSWSPLRGLGRAPPKAARRRCDPCWSRWVPRGHRLPPYAPPAGVGLGLGVTPEPRLRRRRAEGRVRGVAGSGRRAPPPIPPPRFPWRPPRAAAAPGPARPPSRRPPALAPSLLVTPWAPSQINFLALFKTAAVGPLCAALGPGAPPGPPESPAPSRVRTRSADLPARPRCAGGRGYAGKPLLEQWLALWGPPGGWGLWTFSSFI